MNRSLVIITVVCFGLLPSTIVGQGTKKAQPAKKTTAQPADRRLSLDQIRKLIAIQTPDSVVAQEIQSRGINGDYGRREVDQIRQQGAGSQTVDALLRALPAATLTVRTELGAAVKLDGGSPVLAGSDGVATISNIDPGRHEVTIQKQYFTNVSQTVELKGRESASIEVKLNWAVGFLSASTDVPDAQIVVSGGPTQPGRIVHMAVPIGQATVVATAPLRRAVSQAVAIEGGKDATVSLSLPIDQVALSALANQVHASFQSHAYRDAVQQASRYLQTGARSKEVLADLALSFWEMSDYSGFQDSAQRALSAGATLPFDLVHLHSSFGVGTLHRAELQVSTDTLGYKPLDKCNLPEFQTPMKEVHLGKRGLDLSVPEPSNPKKQVNVNLSAGTMPGAAMGAKAKMRAKFREDSGKVDAVRQLLQTLAR